VKLLVTGGAGYIGSVVAHQLVEAGHETVVLDSLFKGDERSVPEGARFVKGDLLDARRVRGVLGEDFDGVLCFAALSLVGESVEQPERYYRVNVCGTLEVLEAMREADVKRLVFSSTAAVYGEPEEVPVTESAAPLPANPYGASMLAADHLIGYAAAAQGLAAVSLRYFNVAAASATPTPPAPSSSRSSSVWPRGDGTRLRFSGRTIRRATARPGATSSTSRTSGAHLLVLEAAQEGEQRIYNLGNGAGFTVGEVIQAARRITGRRIDVVESPKRPGDPAVVVASAQKIRSELGWKPKKPDLETMISDAWDWIKVHSHEYEPGSMGD
jgi:UDP-glucose 4-epimerase